MFCLSSCHNIAIILLISVITICFTLNLELDSHRHFMFIIHHRVNLHCTQHGKRKTRLLCNLTATSVWSRHTLGCENGSSLHALEKLRGEEGSFAIASWRAPRAVFSTAHVFRGVLTVIQKQGVYLATIYPQMNALHSYYLCKYMEWIKNQCDMMNSLQNCINLFNSYLSYSK